MITRIDLNADIGQKGVGIGLQGLGWRLMQIGPTEARHLVGLKPFDGPRAP